MNNYGNIFGGGTQRIEIIIYFRGVFKKIYYFFGFFFFILFYSLTINYINLVYFSYLSLFYILNYSDVF